MNLPDGPKAPRWLQKIQYTADPLGFMDAAGQRYGDIFNAPVIGNTDTLLVSHPQALQQIFSNDTKQFTAPSNQLLQPLVGNHSMFVLEGDRHRRERKLVMPPFHGDRMRSYGQTIIDLTEKAVDRLVPNQVFIARNTVQDISMEVILQVVFGLAEGERFYQLKQRITAFMDVFQVPLLAGVLFFPALQKDFGSRSPWGYIRHLQRQVDELLYAEIRDRQTYHDPSRTDILSLLLSAQDEAGEKMTEVELHDELMTLLLAGHETTATAIAWALYWVHRVPGIRDTALKELETLGQEPDPASIVRLPYLTAVCYEALRIYPVAVLTVPRAVKEPVELMGYSLAAGVRLYGCIYLTHHREDIYPDSRQFKPERFLKRQFSPYEFLPFGGGVRRCIGEALALFEMKLVVATILRRCDLYLADPQPERPKRRGVTMAPERGVQMVMRSRHMDKAIC
ncbi:cytochrome P450 [Oculatella sp. LEGE 06141]|uniref:cytochrome P450 n=1 Tax=Oculatella sp. LEGE 06141 TaxID=1828648 RepID=UPI00187F0BF3|nr:cytochrome P450 [Oculatella sp. LEGE 06141]MBE9180351.1 cytochrome P450 [Oculatella sp. LEGE 06141]